MDDLGLNVSQPNLNHSSWQNHDMLRFLGKEAPRYTSYPSAHHFGGLDAKTYADWLKSLNPDQAIALYVHIPFCEQMCYFCGCNTRQTLRYTPVKAYLEALNQEFDLVAKHLGFRPKVHAVHFGGGSPSIVEPEDLRTLFAKITQHFDISENAEISIELDPRRVTKEKVITYKDLGFNRISLGVQDTDPKVQAAINRVQPYELIQSVFALLREHGLNNIGIDLIYGLPEQTLNSLQTTLHHVSALDPDRISAFSYAHVPWVKKHQTLIDESILPDIQAKLVFFTALSDYFTQNGYVAIGIDHFAKPDDELSLAFEARTMRRNFMGYSTLLNDYLLGFGASSLGELDAGIMQNIPQSTTYEKRIKSGQLATVRGWAYRDDDKLRKAVISDLMCYFTADLGAILQRFNQASDYFDEEIAALKDFIDADVITVNDNIISFRSPLKMLIRSVACVFDTYARQDQKAGRYSKVA